MLDARSVDLIGEWVAFAVSLRLLGLVLAAEYVADFALAFTLARAFE